MIPHRQIRIIRGMVGNYSEGEVVPAEAFGDAENLRRLIDLGVIEFNAQPPATRSELATLAQEIRARLLSDRVAVKPPLHPLWLDAIRLNVAITPWPGEPAEVASAIGLLDTLIRACQPNEGNGSLVGGVGHLDPVHEIETLIAKGKSHKELLEAAAEKAAADKAKLHRLYAAVAAVAEFRAGSDANWIERWCDLFLAAGAELKKLDLAVRLETLRFRGEDSIYKTGMEAAFRVYQLACAGKGKEVLVALKSLIDSQAVAGGSFRAFLHDVQSKVFAWTATDDSKSSDQTNLASAPPATEFASRAVSTGVNKQPALGQQPTSPNACSIAGREPDGSTDPPVSPRTHAMSDDANPFQALDRWARAVCHDELTDLEDRLPTHPFVADVRTDNHRARGDELCRLASALAIRAGAAFGDVRAILREVTAAVESMIGEAWWEKGSNHGTATCEAFRQSMWRCAEATAAVLQLAYAYLPDLPVQRPGTT